MRWLRTVLQRARIRDRYILQRKRRSWFLDVSLKRRTKFMDT